MQLLRILRLGTKVSVIVCVISTVMTGALMWFGVWDSCTVVGPYGHQMWAMLMVPDPSIRLQHWLLPGWAEAMPKYFPLPIIRVMMWCVYMGQTSTAWTANQQTDVGWMTLGLLGPPASVVLSLLCAFCADINIRSPCYSYSPLSFALLTQHTFRGTLRNC